MELVKIRKEKTCYLAYFLGVRRIVPVNKEGAQIIDLFFNKNNKVDEIHKAICGLSKEDIISFLDDIKKQLSKIYDGGYPLINQEFYESPIAAEIQINSKCNLRCKHCFQAEYTKTMPYEKAVEIIDILANANVFEIILVGGELFLHKDIFKIIEHCEKYNFVITIITNGTLLDEEKIKYLSNVKNLSLVVSLEGVGDVNDRIRGTGTFGKVTKTLKLLNKYQIYTEVSCTLNAENAVHYKEMINFCKKNRLSCNFNLFKPFKRNHSNLVLAPEKYFDIAVKVFKLKNNTQIGITNAALTAQIFGIKNRDECKATIAGVTINVDGRMLTCPSLDESGFYKNESLPRVDKNFLENWRNNKYFQEFRQRGLRDCQARAYIFNKSPMGKDPYGSEAFEDYKKYQDD